MDVIGAPVALPKPSRWRRVVEFTRKKWVRRIAAPAVGAALSIWGCDALPPGCREVCHAVAAELVKQGF